MENNSFQIKEPNLNEIIKANDSLLNGLEIKKINIGFTNIVYNFVVS